MLQISNTSLILSYALILLFIGFFYFRKLGLTTTILISSLQGILQLTAAAYVVAWLFKVDDTFILSIMIVMMCSIASYLTARRWQKYRKMWMLIVGVIFSTTFLSLLFLDLIQVITWKAQFVIPIGGILIGQVMNNCSFYIERVTADTIKTKSLIEANLALGASSRQVIEPLANAAIKTCSMPMVDTFKTLGVVYLPGAMAGLIIGGVEPLVAAKYQLVIIFTLTFAFGFSSMGLSLFIHKILFNKNHQLIAEI